jgi:hypothetical protein
MALEKLTFDFVDFGGSIVGGIISSFVFILIWEWWKRPNLRLECIPNDPAVNQIGLGFYHIKVMNEGRSAAQNCHLIITYKNHRLDPLITLDPGKWDKNPEPVAYDPNYGRIADPSLLYHIGEISIGPKGIATFCFLIKYAGEQSCYGFNADNYFHPGLRINDNRRMEMGEYMITVTIKGDNTEREATFLLRNKGSCHADVTIQRRTGNY